MRYVYFLVSLSLIACNSYTEKANDPVDIQKGKKIAAEFYENMLKSDRAEIYRLCSDTTAINDLKSLLKVKDSVLGNIVKVNVKNINTSRISDNSVSSTEYYIELNVVYVNREISEELDIVKLESNQLVLKAYNVELDIKQ